MDGFTSTAPHTTINNQLSSNNSLCNINTLKNTKTYNQNYTSIDELKSFLNSSKTITKNSFSIIHINIISLSKNIDKLINLIAELPFDPDIIALTETKLNQNSSINLVQLDNYNFENINSLTSWGGVGLYIKKDYNYEIKQNFDFFNEKYESLCIKLTSSKKEKIIVGVIYRHPNNSLTDFIENFQNFLHLISNENHTTVLVGDLNIDYNKKKLDPTIRKYIDMVRSFNFQNLIKIPTRVTFTSATVIDHFYTNNKDIITETNVLINDISDHYPIIGFLKLQKDKPNIETTYFRKFTKQNKLNFQLESTKEILHLQHFLQLHPLLPINQKFELLISTLKRAFDNNIPLTKLSKKKYKNKLKPWISKEIKKCINIKLRLLKKLQKTNFKSKKQYDHYKMYKKKLSRLIETSKHNHFQKLFSGCYNDSKSTWQIINKLIGKNKNKSDLPSKIVSQGNIITNPNEIVNCLNQHFATIGSNKTSHIHFDKINSYLNFSQKNSIALLETTATEVSDIISGLKNKKSSGSDNLPTSLFKLINLVISPILADLFNECLNKGYYPDCLKIAKVIPIHKKGDKSDPNNYRPISLLSIINKIFEKIIYTRLSSYFTRFGIIKDSQFGFREGYSTQMAMAKFQEDVLLNFDSGVSTCAILLDLAKAFDTVNRDILLHKLSAYGIRGNMFNLLKSYLSNRYQYMESDHSNSNLIEVLLGVPQGSILSPLLFLILINDLTNCSKFKVINFADDTLLYYNFTQTDPINHILNEELDKIIYWLKINHLKLNVSKTNFMIFSAAYNNPVSIKLKPINNELINCVTSAKYLGYIVDNKLNWKEHITYLITKLSKSLGIMYKIRRSLNTKSLNLVFHSLFLSHIRYGILCYGRADKSTLKPLQIILNNAIRCINFCKRRDKNILSLYNANNFLLIKDMFYLEVSKFMYQFHHNTLPQPFHPYFTKSNHVHHHHTRNQQTNLFIPRINNAKGSLSISFLGSKLWNDIPSTIKSQPTLKSFTNNLKKQLIQSYK